MTFLFKGMLLFLIAYWTEINHMGQAQLKRTLENAVCILHSNACR